MDTALLEAICQALISRFKMPAASALRQLNATHFAYYQIRQGTHISEHLSTCFRLARHADYTGDYHILLAAWNTLDGQIKLALGSPPSISSSKAQFIRTANEQWPTIQELATRFKPQPPPPPLATPSNRPPDGYRQPNRPFPSNRPTPAGQKQIENKAYAAYDGGYMGADGKWAYLEYEDDSAESPKREIDVD